MQKQLNPKKIILFIAVIATIFAAFTLTACGERKGHYDYGEGTKLADVSFPVTIPYITEFTCDYFTATGEKIEDKSTVFEPKDEIFVRVGFTLTADAHAAGKSKVTLKIAPSEEFDGRIYSANTSDSNNRELTTTFTADDRNDKECKIEAKIRFGYNSGRLRINYHYDNEEFAVATITPLNGSSPLVFIYDKETNGYIVKIYATNRWLQNVTEFVVPTDYKGIPVTGIGDQLFWGCKSLKSVTLPSTLKTIGDEAFHDCSALESITLPDSVTSIGEEAFYGCSSLSELFLPDGIENIGYDAFKRCDKITYKTFENGLYLGSKNNPYLCLIKFGYDVENPTIHEDCEVIGRYAFNTSRRWEDTLPVLKNITLPSKVRTICDGAFYYCRSLETAKLSDELISIGDNAFCACTSLKSVTMGDKLKSIGYRGFFGCTSIESITLPDSLTDIGDYALPTSEKLYTVDKFNTGAELWYLGTKNNKYAFLMKSVVPYNVRVKDGCIAIAPRAFYGKYVETVVLPDSVKVIGQEAFWACGKLTNIEMPSVKIIGDSAFSGCSKLESITIPETVTSIGSKAFAGCGLKSVSLPSGITRIEDSMFAGCGSLETVVLPETLTEIGEEAFSKCKSLKNISIPDSVASIGEKAFGDCGALTTVILPESLEKISYGVFTSCDSLITVTIKGNVNAIEHQSFFFAYRLKEITFAGTRKAWLDILSFIPATGSQSFDDTITAHCTDGNVVFDAYDEVLIYLSDPVFVKG